MKILKQSVVAKKLLLTIYALWKNNTEYDPQKNIQSRLVLSTVWRRNGCKFYQVVRTNEPTQILQFFLLAFNEIFDNNVYSSEI